ncbi:hypothetical protein B0H14DRAFT_3488815 [Mycena olivaceomarginata]|nr:hypothetical protein B0H14DRAFT_3488815 [Mycena olivaceomarginata]
MGSEQSTLALETVLTAALVGGGAVAIGYSTLVPAPVCGLYRLPSPWEIAWRQDHTTHDWAAAFHRMNLSSACGAQAAYYTRLRLFSAGGRITPPVWFLSWRMYCTACTLSQLAGVLHRQHLL